MCSCNKKKNADGSARKFTHTPPGGKPQTYSSETDARMAAARQGGTVRPA